MNGTDGVDAVDSSGGDGLLAIGAPARRTGLTVKTVRYYEERRRLIEESVDDTFGTADANPELVAAGGGTIGRRVAG
ncbi:hypothetical protein AB0O31_27630 [Kitasatospora cineracea]|uniref:hypothetical protein n=1 Tax=Kitasatospora cineracea TaxID=88074 RepID=UPI003436E63F